MRQRLMRGRFGVAAHLSAIVAAGLLVSACVMDDSKPKSAAVQPVPEAKPAQIEPYQVASAPAVLSDGSVVPVPRAKPHVASAGTHLGTAVAADAAPSAPMAGPDALKQKAAAYRAFGAAIDDLAGRKFKAPRDVRAALDTLRPHDPELLAEGWIANSAFIAANEPSFAKAVKSAVDRDGKNAVMAQLRSGNGVWLFEGTQQARSEVVADAAATYDKLTGLGERFLATAIEFQRTRWGSYEPAAPFSVSPEFAASEVGGRDFASILGELAGVTEAKAAAGPVMQRILVLAGHLAIQDASAGESSDLMANPDLARCARFARLNLNQCLAAAHFPSEEAYCTGKHGVNEIAGCWAEFLPAAAAE